MKKFLFSLFAMVLFITAANLTRAQGNPNSYDNRARAAAHDCLDPAHGPFSTVYANLTTTARCIDGGTSYVYEVWVIYECPPNTLCLVVRPQLLATVVFDCEGRISDVTCYAGPF